MMKQFTLWLAQKSQEKEVNTSSSWIFFKILRWLKFLKSIVADDDEKRKSHLYKLKELALKREEIVLWS